MGQGGYSTFLPANHFATTLHAALRTELGQADKPGILAVSGGADSIAMWRAFREHPWTAGITVAHFNHQLRGTESDADAEFVRALATEAMPCVIGTADVGAVATQTGDNLEATARRLRYAFLLQTAEAQQACWIATAHTADDQAETVLHRLIRGSGLRGLRGIAPTRPLSEGVQLVRPMLTLSRAAVLEYLHTQQQPWREDSTNQQTDFTRNRLRHQLLPLLQTFNPQVQNALNRLAAQAQEVFTEIDQQTWMHLSQLELPKAGHLVILNREPLSQLSNHQLRELLRAVWEREQWPQGGMSHEHWQRAATVARGELTATDLPGRLYIRAASRVIRIGPSAADS